MGGPLGERKGELVNPEFELPDIDKDPSKRGMYCRHGKHLLVPAGDAAYPDYVPADPWPCAEPECSLERVEQEFEQEEADYWEALMSEVPR